MSIPYFTQDYFYKTFYFKRIEKLIFKDFCVQKLILILLLKTIKTNLI